MYGLKKATIDKWQNITSEAVLAACPRAHVQKGGDSKLGDRVLTVSMTPLTTCPADCPCAGFCYALRGSYFRRPSCRVAWDESTALYRLSPEAWWDSLYRNTDKALNRGAIDGVRLFVSGDAPRREFFWELADYAEEFPGLPVWSYTKRYSWYDDYLTAWGALPDDLTVQCSIWRLPDGGIWREAEVEHLIDKGATTFDVRMAKGQKMHGMKCPGSCDFCLKHKTGCACGKSAWTDLHN